jgi:hypothetical protein
VATIDEYIAGLDETLGSIAATLRAHLDTGLPQATGQMWHGHPVWLDGKTPIAGFKAYPNYVTFLLWRGQSIDDESGTLAPSGSGEMGSLKIASENGFSGERLDDWLRQVSELEK